MLRPSGKVGDSYAPRKIESSLSIKSHVKRGKDRHKTLARLATNSKNLAFDTPYNKDQWNKEEAGNSKVGNQPRRDVIQELLSEHLSPDQIMRLESSIFKPGRKVSAIES